MIDLSGFRMTDGQTMTAQHWNYFFTAVQNGFSTINDIVSEWKQTGAGIVYTFSPASGDGAKCTTNMWNSNVGDIYTKFNDFQTNDYYESSFTSYGELIEAIDSLRGKVENDEVSVEEWNTLVYNVQSLLNAAVDNFSEMRDAAAEGRKWRFGNAMPIRLSAS